jgi:hypothetical protein
MHAGVPTDVPICVSAAHGARGADGFRDAEVGDHRDVA